MVSQSLKHSGFFSSQEIEVTKQFLDSGFIISNCEDMDSLDRIRTMLAEITAVYLDDTFSEPEKLLNKIHTRIRPEQLNDLRVYIIQKINSEPWLRRIYFELARSAIETLVGNELAMQLRVNLSIQMPQDDSSLLPVHADVWSGDSPFEVVVWLPLVDCYGSKSMFLLPPIAAEQLTEKFTKFQGKSSEDIFREIEPDLEWIEIDYGLVLIFNQNLPHGNRINEENETRWSMNCRFKSIFSPYGDKKLGEFFEPITLRPASRIGLGHRLPQV